MPASNNSLIGAATTPDLHRDRVTVIPADHLIMVDGEALTFDFSSQPADLHALHWDGKAVAMEHIASDGAMSNAHHEGDLAYNTYVAPFVALWQAEQDRREVEANTPPSPPTLADKTAHLAAVRWQAEISGTVWRDYTLQTDDRSQAKYLAELAAIDQGVRTDPSPWKMTEGFVMLSNADIKAMAIAARAHVMACFAAEAAVVPMLEGLACLDSVEINFKIALEHIKSL